MICGKTSLDLCDVCGRNARNPDGRLEMRYAWLDPTQYQSVDLCKRCHQALPKLLKDAKSLAKRMKEEP